MFDRAGIVYHPVDPDSVAYQHEARGGKTRATPNARTRVVRIQQGFVGGEFSGGCTEVFEAWRDGLLQDLLRRNDGAVRELERDPYTFSEAGCARSRPQRVRRRLGRSGRGSAGGARKKLQQHATNVPPRRAKALVSV